MCEQATATTKRASASPDRGHSMIPAINRINNSASTSFANSSSVNSSIYLTPRSLRTARNGTFQSFPIVNTPTPPSRFKRIINPFEIGLTDRLHLPLIGSPSLFHRPDTPQHCSTPTHNDFEWTIDEVSSLNPANVEAYETQFLSNTDPDVETRAQAAISSFFKTQVIVPSPSVHVVRDPPNDLINADTPSLRQSKKRKRSGSTQTELTLPPILPPDLEEALKPYFSFTGNQQQSPTYDCDASMNSIHNESIDHEARDASLRRKLFPNSPSSSEISDTDYQQDFELQLDSPAPQTPDMIKRYGAIGHGQIHEDDIFLKLEGSFCEFDDNLDNEN